MIQREEMRRNIMKETNEKEVLATTTQTTFLVNQEIEDTVTFQAESKTS